MAKAIMTRIKLYKKVIGMICKEPHTGQSQPTYTLYFIQTPFNSLLFYTRTTEIKRVSTSLTHYHNLNKN